MGDFKLTSDRESTVEDTTVAWAENNGWVVRFMKYRGRNGCPDVFFFGYGRIVMIEFKKSIGGELSWHQIKEHERMEDVGLEVFVYERAENAIAHLRSLM